MTGVSHRAWPGEQDRKSTRLNSSHLVISYAVFCLKKKNTSHPFSFFLRCTFLYVGSALQSDLCLYEPYLSHSDPLVLETRAFDVGALICVEVHARSPNA